jgi:hypothetical protein
MTVGLGTQLRVSPNLSTTIHKFCMGRLRASIIIGYASDKVSYNVGILCIVLHSIYFRGREVRLGPEMLLWTSKAIKESPWKAVRMSSCRGLELYKQTAS